MDSVSDRFLKLYEIVKTLRGPGGCPWDIEQTPSSLRSALIEEVYECIDAINHQDDANMREELGDLFLLATMISYMKEQESAFSVADVLAEISEKLVRRHPHVFEEKKDMSSAEVLTQWDTIKKIEKVQQRQDSVLDSVPSTLPPLEKAFRLQKKAAKLHFDWKKIQDVWSKIREEIDECEQSTDGISESNVEEEIGDLLFSIVNVSRHLGIDPAVALHTANGKFTKRFQYIEQEMAKKNRAMNSANVDFMARLWNKYKELENQSL